MNCRGSHMAWSCPWKGCWGLVQGPCRVWAWEAEYSGSLVYFLEGAFKPALSYPPNTALCPPPVTAFLPSPLLTEPSLMSSPSGCSYGSIASWPSLSLLLELPNPLSNPIFSLSIRTAPPPPPCRGFELSLLISYLREPTQSHCFLK